jgi:hypothetical protein
MAAQRDLDRTVLQRLIQKRWPEGRFQNTDDEELVERELVQRYGLNRVDAARQLQQLKRSYVVIT